MKYLVNKESNALILTDGTDCAPMSLGLVQRGGKEMGDDFNHYALGSVLGDPSGNHGIDEILEETSGLPEDMWGRTTAQLVDEGVFVEMSYDEMMVA